MCTRRLINILNLERKNKHSHINITCPLIVPDGAKILFVKFTGRPSDTPGFNSLYATSTHPRDLESGCVDDAFDVGFSAPHQTTLVSQHEGTRATRLHIARRSVICTKALSYVSDHKRASIFVHLRRLNTYGVSLHIQNCNFTGCFVWVWNSVSHIKDIMQCVGKDEGTSGRGRIWDIILVFLFEGLSEIRSGKPRLTTVRIRCADRATPSIRKSSRSGGRSVGTVRSWTKATELIFFSFSLRTEWNHKKHQSLHPILWPRSELETSKI
jgi:hypothetical protein